jgi:RND superfamily putative drug exporter
LPGLSRILFQLPRFLSRDNSIARFEITWDDNPYDNKVISNIGTFKNDIKDFAAQSGLEAKGVIVGGETATYYDIKKSTIRDLLLIGPLILLVVWLILVALLKSLVAPTYLIVSILLSFGSAFGVTVFFFQFVLGQAGVAFENLMWMFVFLIALGADYNIYMMSRIQEEVTLRGIKDGIQEAVSRTGGVITSAGLILAGTFMVLFTLPLQPISQLGFGVAIGVLIDTFIVRGFLVPSMVATIRHWSWWPNPLYKKLHW